MKYFFFSVYTFTLNN